MLLATAGLHEYFVVRRRVTVVFGNTHQSCAHLVKQASLEYLGIYISPHVTSWTILDNNLSSTNSILYHKISILGVLGALGA